MSAHNVIVVTPAPAGRFLEGTISGTPKPGTMMEPVPGTALDGMGRLTWRVYTGAGTDGERTLVAILRENLFLGKGKNDAYADGDHCYLYCPIPGDEVQVLLKNISGTSENIDEGDKLIHDSGTGLFIETTGSPESEPFIAEEAISNITADIHCLCLYTGH